MRVVLDSSVLVSAFLNPAGSPALLIAHARQEAFSLYISADILEETARALSRERIAKRYGYTPEEVGDFVTLIADLAELVSKLSRVPAISRDPNDDKIIACAVKARARYLVTGDDDLLILTEHEGVRIVTPKQFLDVLTNQAE